MKQFLKVVDKGSVCFKYSCKLFPSLSNEKVKADIFEGPQINNFLAINYHIFYAFLILYWLITVAFQI